MKSKIFGVVLCYFVLFVDSAQSNEELSCNGEVRQTLSGFIFVRDNRYDYVLEQGWRDPSGLIWGDLARGFDLAHLVFSNIDEAQSHCNSKGARLPTVSEYQQLSYYMGLRQTETGEDYGYRPEIVGHLTSLAWCSDGFGSRIFDGFYGNRFYRGGPSGEKYSFRCVIQSR